jgi:hypothetical protein
LLAQLLGLRLTLMLHMRRRRTRRRSRRPHARHPLVRLQGCRKRERLQPCRWAETQRQGRLPRWDTKLHRLRRNRRTGQPCLPLAAAGLLGQLELLLLLPRQHLLL